MIDKIIARVERVILAFRATSLKVVLSGFGIICSAFNEKAVRYCGGAIFGAFWY